MKLIISTTLVIAVMIQLSMADDASYKAVQPPNDKLYPIFDLIATRMSEYQKKELSIVGAIYKKLLEEYKVYMETHNSQIYQDYKTAIESLLETLELHEQRPDNCHYQREAEDEIKAVHVAEPNDENVKVIVNKAINNPEYKAEYKKLINEFTAQFPDVIKNFITTLDESEQKQYADLYQLGQEFLKASQRQEKLRAFQDFITKIKFTKNTVTGNESNCKWDVTKFDKFTERIKSFVFIDINTINF